MAANIFGGRLTGLLYSLIVRLRDLPFAVDHIGETGSDFINDFLFQVPQPEPVFSYPDEEGPDSFITNFASVPPSPSQLDSVVDFPASGPAASPPRSSVNFEKMSASVNASEHLEFWKARFSNVPTSHQSIYHKTQFNQRLTIDTSFMDSWTLRQRESRLVFSDPIKERRLRLPAAAIRKKRRWP